MRTYWGRDIVAIAIANSFVGAELSEQRSIGPTPNCGRIRFGNGELRLVLLYIMGDSVRKSAGYGLTDNDSNYLRSGEEPRAKRGMFCCGETRYAIHMLYSRWTATLWAKTNGLVVA